MKKQLYQGIIWRGLFYVSVFFLNIMIARLFQATESGTINYIINNLAFVILCTSISLDSAMGFYAAKNQISQNKLVWFGVVMTMVSVVLSFAILSLVPDLTLNSTHRWYLPVLYVGGIVLWNYTSALFYAKFNYVVPNVISIANNILIIVIAYVFFYDPLKASNEEKFLDFYFFSFLLQAFILFMIYAYRSGALTKIQFPESQELRKLFKYSFLALAGNIIFFLVYRLDYWFVNKNCSPKELGNYIQVSKLVQVFLLIPAFISSVIFTKTAGENSNEHSGSFKLISRLLTSVYFIIILDRKSVV